MRISKWILNHIGAWLPGREAVRQHLKLLSTGTDGKKEEEAYYLRKVSLLLKVLLAGLGITVAAGISAHTGQSLKEGCYLPRRPFAYRQELWVQAEGEEAESLTVLVEPKKLSREESKELLRETVEQMETYILGENKSLEEVRKDLKLITRVEGLPVKLTWELDSYEVLNLDGSLRPENLKEAGSIVELTACLSCNQEEAVYRGYARVLPPLLSPAEIFLQELTREMEELEESGGEKDHRELPLEVQGKRLTWEEKPSSAALGVLILTLVSLAAVYMAQDRELGQKTRERERQMRRDYGRIVSKLVLLMGAGATVRFAWELIVRDYQAKREQGAEELRYAYEEMALTVREMQNGIAEVKAYESFGLRCRIPCYLKLSILLEQNLRKGSQGLTELLQGEVQEAFEQRREQAACAGEEAATRLLLPMILMLVVVMLLILVPAGMSMQM